MCKAKEYSKELLELIDKIENEKLMLCEKISKCDLATSEILHQIELRKFNACEGFELCKALQQIRKERRMVKLEIDPINSMYSKMEINSLKVKVKHTIKNIERLEDRELYRDL